MEQVKCGESGMRCHCANCNYFQLKFEWQNAENQKGEKYDLGRIVAECGKHHADEGDEVKSDLFELPDLNGENIWITWRSFETTKQLDSYKWEVVVNTIFESYFSPSEVPKAWRKFADEFIDSHDCVIPLECGEHAKDCCLFVERTVEDAQ